MPQTFLHLCHSFPLWASKCRSPCLQYQRDVGGYTYLEAGGLSSGTLLSSLSGVEEVGGVLTFNWGLLFAGVTLTGLLLPTELGPEARPEPGLSPVGHAIHINTKVRQRLLWECYTR